MNRHHKLSIFLALFMAMVLALPGVSWAGGYRYGGYYGDGHGYRGYNYSGNRYPGYYGGRGYYYRGYYPGYYPGYYGCGNCGNNHHHNNNDDLWLGLLGGTIIGYTLNAIHQGY